MSPTLSTASPAEATQSTDQNDGTRGSSSNPAPSGGSTQDPPSGERAATAKDRVILAGVVVNQRVRGRYRIGRMWQRLDVHGAPFWLVEIIDRTASLRTYAWPEKVVIASALPEATLVDVEFVAHAVQRLVGKLYAFEVATDPTGLDHVATLPAGICPVPGIVDELYALLAEVKTAALQRFVGAVFGDVERCRRFFRVPASLKDHHAGLGGLARHSVQGAKFLASIQCFSQVERELAIVSFLFHDIGKIRTHDSTALARDTWRLVQHDDLTLEVLADALKLLDRDWPDGALALRHSWTCASPGASYGIKAASLFAKLVRVADSASQDLDLTKMYLVPPTRYHRLSDGRQLWLPGEP